MAYIEFREAERQGLIAKIRLMAVKGLKIYGDDNEDNIFRKVLEVTEEGKE